MQSPDKLRQRLSELLGPPGPDADPLELTLRSIIAVTAPTLGPIVEQMTPEMLDSQLENVALFFLSIRSDGEPVSLEFLQALGHAAAAPIDATEATPELPPAPAPAPAQAPGQQLPVVPQAAPEQPAVPQAAPAAPVPQPGAPRPPWG